MERKLKDDCPNIEIIPLTTFTASSFYGKEVTPDSVASFWAQPRLFKLPMDVGVYT